MAKKLIFPDDARDWLRRRYERNHRRWLEPGDDWPLSLSLGEPTEVTLAENVEAVRAWVDAWRAWNDGGEVQWQERQWPRLGRQHVPHRLSCDSAAEATTIIGEAERWRRATQRYEALVNSWSCLREDGALSRHFDLLADYADEDFGRLLALVSWLSHNPTSGLYLRQLPVEGIHTKWIDARRRTVVADLLRRIRASSAGDDFFAVCGLNQPPHRVRMRVLCPSLSKSIGGFGDVEAPLQDLAALPLRPDWVFVVENLETGIALPELPGCVAFMKLGASVGVLAAVPWLEGIPARYWGDLDTHGFAILDRARAALPRTRSILMNESTLLAHRLLWGRETEPHPDAALPHLTTAERALFDKLRANEWGQGVRLEQERIPWPFALDAIHASLHE